MDIMMKAPIRKATLFLISLLCSTFAASQPIASFEVDRYNICSGQTVHFNNTSTSSNTYEWLIEGTHYSFSRDTLAVLYEGCYDLKEIKLIVGDTITGLFDSATIVVEVFDTCFFHWTGTFINCPNDTIFLAANAEAIATEFFISDPVTILSGCLVCPSIEFILQNSGTYVDRTTTYLGGCLDVTSYEYICFSTEINETIIVSVEIFPNPVTDHILVSTDAQAPARLEVLNITGQLVLDQNLYDKKTLINFSAFPSGIYLCKFYLNNETLVTRKIIKAQ